MMTYTENGLALIADAVASGKQVKFSRIELIADPERSAGELTYNTEIASVEKYNSTTIDIKVVTDNYNFKNDYFFNQVNVYAIGSAGKEVLFCFQHTETCPVYIPKYDGRTIQNEIKIRVTVTSADVVDIVNDGVYVLRTDFEKELAKKINISDIIQDTVTGEVDKVVSAFVAKMLQEQIDNKIDIKNIVQNTVTTATDKVVSAAVAKALQDQITALNTKKTNTAMIDNAFYYYGEKPAVSPSFSVYWPMSLCWMQLGNAYIVDFVLNVATNTAFAQDAAKDFYSFGLNLNHIRNTILGGKTPSAFRGMGSWFLPNGTRPTEKYGGGLNGYGLYLWIDPQNGVIKIGRYYTATGGNGQWAITNYEPGMSITGRLYLAV